MVGETVRGAAAGEEGGSGLCIDVLPEVRADDKVSKE